MRFLLLFCLFLMGCNFRYSEPAVLKSPNNAVANTTGPIKATDTSRFGFWIAGGGVLIPATVGFTWWALREREAEPRDEINPVWDEEQRNYAPAYREVGRKNPNTHIKPFWWYPKVEENEKYGTDPSLLKFKRENYGVLFSAIGDCAARSVMLVLLFYAFQSDKQFDYFIDRLKEAKASHPELEVKKWFAYLKLLKNLKDASPLQRVKLLNDWDNDWLLLVNTRQILSTLLADPTKKSGMQHMAEYRGEQGKVIIGSVLKAVSTQWPGLLGVYLHITKTDNRPYSITKWSWFEGPQSFFWAAVPTLPNILPEGIVIAIPDIVIESDEAHTNVLALPKLIGKHKGAFLSF